MPRKTTPLETEEAPESIEAKLDRMLEYLHRMERRDRTRMIGSYIHSMFWLISVGFLVWSTWFFAVHGQELITTLTKQMMEQSMGLSSGAATDATTTDKYMKMLDSLMKGNK